MRLSFGFLIWLAGLSILGFLATDMYLPAFGAMAKSLNSDPSFISASLSLYLAGFALAQLVWGPLSDRFGRRTILLIGLIIFAVGSLSIVWATSPAELLLFRFVQAVGACAAAVIWPTLVTDNYPQSETKRVFAAIMPLVGLSPALAPLLGSWLLQHYSWPAIFIVLALLSLLLLLPLRLFTAPKPPQVTGKTLPAVNYWHLIRNACFSGNVIIYAACSASFFAWLTGSPFILSAMGYTPADIGLSYIPQTLAFLIGGYGCRAALKHWQDRSLLPWLLALYAISVTATWGISLFAAPPLAAILAPFCLMALANGAIYPLVVANALAVFPQASGRATALQNALQLGLCFLASLLVSTFIAHPLIATTSTMLSTAAIALLGYWLRQRAVNRVVSAVSFSH